MSKVSSGFTWLEDSATGDPVGLRRVGDGAEFTLPVVTGSKSQAEAAAAVVGAAGATRLPAVTTSSADAATNAAAINAALLLGGTVQIVAAGTVYVSSTLSIPDNTTLYVGPQTTLKLADSANTGFIRNSQFSASPVTVTATSSGQVATVTWTAHGKSVGDYFAMQGANQEAYNGLWRVASVVDANTITVTLDQTPSATPATGTLQVRAVNIGCGVIADGTLDANEANQTLADDNTRQAVIFYNVLRPRIGGRFVNARKYCCLMANVRDVDASPMSFQTASDGLHFQGVIGANIASLQGYCGDDMLAFTQGDYSQYELFRGPVDGINVGRIHGENSLKTALKIAGGAARVKNIKVDHITGSLQNSVIGVIEDTNLTATYVENLSIGTLSAKWGSTLNAIQVTHATTSCTVDQVNIDSLSAALSGTQGVIAVSGASGLIRRSVIRACNVDASALSGAGALWKQATNGVLGTVELSNWRIVGTSNMYGVLQDYGVNRMYIRDGEWSGGGFLVRVNSSATTTPEVFLSGVSTNNTNNPIDFRKPANLYTSSWRHSGSTAVNINGTGTVNWYGEIVSSNTHIGIAGGMTVNINGASIKADVTTIARQDGAQIYNTNAAAGTLGVAGPVVCLGTAANSWKLLTNPTAAAY